MIKQNVAPETIVGLFDEGVYYIYRVQIAQGADEIVIGSLLKQRKASTEY
jgi:hypothetical protein